MTTEEIKAQLTRLTADRELVVRRLRDERARIEEIDRLREQLQGQLVGDEQKSEQFYN